MQSFSSPKQAQNTYKHARTRFENQKKNTAAAAVKSYNKRIENAAILKAELSAIYNNTSSIPSRFLDVIVEFDQLLTEQTKLSSVNPDDPAAYENAIPEIIALLGGGVAAVAFIPLVGPFLAVGAVFLSFLFADDKKSDYYREVRGKLTELNDKTAELRSLKQALQSSSNRMDVAFAETIRLLSKLKPHERRDYGDYSDQDRELFRELMAKVDALKELYEEDLSTQ